MLTYSCGSGRPARSRVGKTAGVKGFQGEATVLHPQGFQDFLPDEVGVGLTGHRSDQQFDQGEAVAAIDSHLARCVLQAFVSQRVPKLGGVAVKRDHGQDIEKMRTLQAGRMVEQHAHGDGAIRFAVGHAEVG